ncbi:hypothetical protein BpOF4_05430 [Alkalihalophilus pseudofirmus OF4]|jgi:DUF4097 and DUF4098 domain-containing protein YvlB|uniref:Uncharacterized protein n=1 Tax=Alkalihalophilus pseudofirmus (strain ATCC BAA-2126 / JCM 17055 / OF4) TaxID=398511 RepID=D3FYC5_ALKPO|nr:MULTISPECIES: DUF4097 domain-containing protein [Alkalihalophilus]ADC49148.1 hypothetical protein BpOF4_05430 [Alkalihalophilus pseudofirmus OF4]MCM3491721.1 DUF4097 domain-containing protein [Alkalihalophilus marmarensis]
MEERKMILKMIEDGKITAEEGIKLLEAMDTKAEPEPRRAEPASLSTDVNWDEGEEYKKRNRQSTSAENRFASFIDTALQKIKDFDLDFNFGSSVVVDHIFQHRDLAPANVDISLENGSITFVPWEEPDVRIECQARVYRVKDSEEARRVFLQEATFRVNEQKVLFHTKVKSIKVQATVYVPKTTFEHLKLYTFNGQIKGEQIHVDTFDVNTLNGAISFKSIKAKKIMAETVNGAIELEHQESDLVDVKTVNGSITLSGKAQDVDAETVNGGITYKLDALNESGYADLKATTGSIHLYVPEDIRVEGKLKTNVGGFTVDLANHEILDEKKEFAQKSTSFVGNQQSSPRVKVNAVTYTGSILVKDR